MLRGMADPFELRLFFSNRLRGLNPCEDNSEEVVLFAEWTDFLIFDFSLLNTHVRIGDFCSFVRIVSHIEFQEHIPGIGAKKNSGIKRPTKPATPR